ncbi:hypothetical protein [Sphingomonas sp. GM_Shp_1]|uniref:hypothetical protein n=1 Tax=Sphingomonas sp. GM_Shp_1 TaxID=2937381 RepID=UPI00226B8842|nr:hypothetical protein [Sphingomonas sp. GM_Shp_1]
MTKLIDRIAARFGFRRSLPPELIVFYCETDARRAGFVGQRHPDLPHLQAWWPALDVRGLRVRPVQRITVARDMLFTRTSEGRLGDLLRARQAAFGPNAVWIEL